MGNYTTKITPNYEEIEVDVAYYYQPSEPPSKDMEYGGCAEDFQIEAIIHDGIDITKYLHEDIVEKLEEDILKFLKDY